MKCIKRIDDGKVIRVHNDVAAECVDSGNWKYAPKSEWKAQGRVRFTVTTADLDRLFPNRMKK